MSFLKSLFGRKDSKPSEPVTVRTLEHNGYTIRATPYKEGGQYQLCGVIEKEIGGQVLSHRFVRADRFPGVDEAADFTLVKAQQIIDQQGEALFKPTSAA